jgi:osmotically-inducible protein OsmY
MTRNRPLIGIVASLSLLTILAVARADEAADQQLTQEVKDKLHAKDPQVAQRIEVTTHDGIVTLRGDALTAQYILNVLRDAGSIKGVAKVENHLTIN